MIQSPVNASGEGLDRLFGNSGLKEPSQLTRGMKMNEGMMAPSIPI